MKKNLRSFFAGCLTTLLCVGLIGTAAATVAKQQVTISYNDIKVTLNGENVNLVDVNGNAVEPFIISGTTYLPLRAIATALGLDVQWDSANKTAVLTTKADPDMTDGTVLLDQNGIKITYLGIGESTSFMDGYEIKLLLQNTTDTNYTVQIRDLSVNGFMTDAVFSCDVAAGKSAHDSIGLYYLEKDGITGPIEEAEFRFHIFDSDTWMTDFDSDIITVK